MKSLLTIKAVGDVSFGDHPVCVGHGVASRVRRRGADFLFEHARASLAGGDVVVCNLEGVTSKVGFKPWSLTSSEMRGEPSSLDGLQRAGFNVVCIANNHVLQHGLEAFADMRQQLLARRIEYIGIDDSAGASVPYVHVKDGYRYHFLAFSMHPEEHCAGRTPYSLRMTADEVLAEVVAFRARHDEPLVVSLHWGFEFLDYPSSWQVALGHALIDAGVSVVLGHHSHVVQHIERYKAGAIFYSLGNFVFDQWASETKKTLIATIVLAPTGEVEFSTEPYVINDVYQPEPAQGENYDQVKKLLERGQDDLEAATSGVTDDEYRLRSRRRRAELRPQTYRHFLGRLYMCPPHLAVQSLLRTASRRLRGE